MPAWISLGRCAAPAPGSEREGGSWPAATSRLASSTAAGSSAGAGRASALAGPAGCAAGGEAARAPARRAAAARGAPARRGGGHAGARADRAPCRRRACRAARPSARRAGRPRRRAAQPPGAPARGRRQARQPRRHRSRVVVDHDAPAVQLLAQVQRRVDDPGRHDLRRRIGERVAAGDVAQGDLGDVDRHGSTATRCAACARTTGSSWTCSDRTRTGRCAGSRTGLSPAARLPDHSVP
jgi:hypothetical protein